MITKLDQIVRAVQGRGRKKLAVAYPQDSHTLEAVNAATDMGIVEAILIGDREQIVKVCMADGIDPEKFSIVDEKNDAVCVETAVRMIRDSMADVLMKGLVSTDKYMRGILNKDFGLLPPKGVLSHVAVLELPMYHKLLLVSDVAVIPYPDMNQKIRIAKYLIGTSRTLGIRAPKLAVIAPSEQMLPGIQSSVDAAILAKMGDRGQLGDALVDGPLAVDVALVREAAETKRLTSSVAGDADCLLFPNLDAANAFFKAATKLCGARLAGMVVGTRCPCVLTSRGDSPESKLYSIAGRFVRRLITRQKEAMDRQCVILVVNPGATWTKVSVYDDLRERVSRTIRHSADELKPYASVADQFGFRRDLVLEALREEGVEFASLSAVIGRGGLVKPIESGVYEVNDALRRDLGHAPQGEHALNLGGLIAADIASRIPGARASIADPVVVDELDDVARVAGHPLFRRVSIFHALNQKATGRRYARENGRAYEDMNLTSRMGGGISVGAHRRGRVVDVNNALDGDGATLLRIVPDRFPPDSWPIFASAGNFRPKRCAE